MDSFWVRFRHGNADVLNWIELGDWEVTHFWWLVNVDGGRWKDAGKWHVFDG
jgi:hypothetical protein